MPSRTWPIWTLSASLLLGLPLLNFIYWPEVLRSGVLRPESDSIDIPMFGSILLAVVLMPVVLGMTAFCLRRYNEASRFLAWKQARPLKSGLATLFLGVPAGLTIIGAILEIGQDEAWYEYLWMPYEMIWVVWFLALRAAVVDQLDPEAG